MYQPHSAKDHNRYANRRRDSTPPAIGVGAVTDAREPCKEKTIIWETKLSSFILNERRTQRHSVTGPLFVLAAGKRPLPPGMTEKSYSDIRRAIDKDRVEAAHLSRNSKFVLDPNSGHNIQLTDPDVVAQAVEAVVTAVRDHTKLAPSSNPS